MDGIVTVLNTPFTQSNEIDTAGLQCNVANALDAGVSGFLVGGLAGEVAYLTEAERLHVLTATQEVVCGSVPIIGGAFGTSPAERLRTARLLVDANCDGIMASIPANEATFEQEVRDIASFEPGFLMIQDWDPGGSGIAVDTIITFFDSIPAFTWLKIEVIPAGPKYTEVLDRTDGRLKVAGGWAVREMIDALDRGVHAFMPTGMHRIYTTIHRSYRSGDREQAQSLFNELLPILNLSNRDLDSSIHFFKRLLHAQGVYDTASTRSPEPKPDDTTEREIAHAIEMAIQLENSLR